MPEITLEPGGASERLATQIKLDPTATLSRRAVSVLLGITPALVDNAVQAAVGLGLVTSVNDMDHGRIYKAGPRLHLWAMPAGKQAASQADAGKPATQPAPAPAAMPAAAPPAAKKSRAKKAYLPALQLSLLKVEKNLPMPAGRGAPGKGQTKYDAVLDLLKADGDAVTGIANAYDGAIRKAITAYLKHRPQLKAQFVVRKTDAEHIGVWRVAASGQAKALKAA